MKSCKRDENGQSIVNCFLELETVDDIQKSNISKLLRNENYTLSSLLQNNGVLSEDDTNLECISGIFEDSISQLLPLLKYELSIDHKIMVHKHKKCFGHLWKCFFFR